MEDTHHIVLEQKIHLVLICPEDDYFKQQEGVPNRKLFEQFEDINDVLVTKRVLSGLRVGMVELI